MKLLKVVANNFKLFEKDVTINFVPTSKKTEEDKEYELQEIAENLYIFNTLAFIGKNASGKTSAIQLLSVVYDILSNFRIKSSKSIIEQFDKVINLDITFFNDGIIYRYITDIKNDLSSIKFMNQHIFLKKYVKSNANEIFNYEKYEEKIFDDELPEDTSLIFKILSKIYLRGLFFECEDEREEMYSPAFNIYKLLNTKEKNMIASILKMFDEHIKNIEMLEEDKFKITYTNNYSTNFTSKEMYTVLSSGTTKGIGLFTFVIYSLQSGADLIIDEIENHFHKTLVENLISLYKDKRINKNHASLIFTTHYCELLDLFNRSDNIYITKYDKEIRLENMYINHSGRTELLKSKRFYQNAFNTAVSYESLMKFKEELM